MDKLLWVGEDYRNPDGYIARELLPLLAKKYDISHFSIECKGISEDYYVIDASDGTPYGSKKLASVINTVKPKYVILAHEHAVIQQWLSITTKHKAILIPYVSKKYIGNVDIDLYNKCSGLLSLSKFTISELNECGLDIKSHRLSLGARIEKKNKEETRKELNVPDDTFVFFSANKNKAESRLDILIRAYVDLIKNHADKKTLLVVQTVGDWINLKELYERLCKENELSNTQKYIYFCEEVKDEELSKTYNAYDVGVSTSIGESGGYKQMVHSAHGIPQIIPNWGGIIESVKHGSLKVDTKDYVVVPEGEGKTVFYKDVSKAMETYLLNRELYETHCKDAEKNAILWETVAEQMQAFLGRF